MYHVHASTPTLLCVSYHEEEEAGMVCRNLE
jgi:hypothetical protein